MSSLPRVLCPRLPAPQAPVLLDEQEAAHLQQSLRLRPGDPVMALDGKGSEVPGRTFLRDKKLWVETDEPAPTRTLSSDQETTALVLEMAIIKGDSMSWVIEKAVELGARAIVPVICDHGVVDLGKKGTEHFVERWQRIADQALKQCERLNRLKVEAPLTLGQVLGTRAPVRAIACEPSLGITDTRPLPAVLRASGQAPVHVLIGPEGGWSAAETQAMGAEFKLGRAVPVSLGGLVLRAETAAVFALSAALCSRIS